MILDKFHPQLENFSEAEKSRLDTGLCAKCGHDTFKVETNVQCKITGVAMDFLRCLAADCNETYYKKMFHPQRIIYW